MLGRPWWSEGGQSLARDGGRDASDHRQRAYRRLGTAGGGGAALATREAARWLASQRPFDVRALLTATDSFPARARWSLGARRHESYSWRDWIATYFNGVETGHASRTIQERPGDALSNAFHLPRLSNA